MSKLNLKIDDKTTPFGWVEVGWTTTPTSNTFGWLVIRDGKIDTSTSAVPVEVIDRLKRAGYI